MKSAELRMLNASATSSPPNRGPSPNGKCAVCELRRVGKKLRGRQASEHGNCQAALQQPFGGGYGVQPGVSSPELYSSSMAARLTICGPSPLDGDILGVIGIVRPPIRASAAAIVDSIRHGFDPLTRFNLAAMSW